MIELRKIAFLDDTMHECIALQLAPEREDFLWSNAVTLAIAHRRYKKFCAAMECRAIYADGVMVGLLSYHYNIDSPDFKETCYRLRTIMVDKTNAGKGYEEAALRLALAEIRTLPHGAASTIFAAYNPKDVDAAAWYAAVGFVPTDMKWNNPNDKNIIARLGL